VLKGSGLNAGQLFLECRYLIQASGHATMQLSRYLPPVIKRLLLAEAGVDVADKLTDQLVERFSSTVPMNVAVEVLKVRLPVIKKQLKAADEQMHKALPALQQQALAQLDRRMSAEINRLEELAKANGQVRHEEIAYLQQRQSEAHQSINQIQPQLDSVRILVTM
jgi:ATP-dependent helicase HepA